MDVMAVGGGRTRSLWWLRRPIGCICLGNLGVSSVKQGVAPNLTRIGLTEHGFGLTPAPLFAAEPSVEALSGRPGPVRSGLLGAAQIL